MIGRILYFSYFSEPKLETVPDEFDIPDRGSSLEAAKKGNWVGYPMTGEINQEGGFSNVDDMFDSFYEPRWCQVGSLLIHVR